MFRNIWFTVSDGLFIHLGIVLRILNTVGLFIIYIYIYIHYDIKKF